MNPILQVLLFITVSTTIAICIIIVWRRRQHRSQEVSEDAKQVRQDTFVELQEDKLLQAAEEHEGARDRRELQKTTRMKRRPRRAVRTAKEFAKHGSAEEAFEHENGNTLKTQKEKRHIESVKRRIPEERGGRPRGASPRSGKIETSGSHPLRSDVELKPEMVCWKREGQWMLGVQVPEELLEKPGLRVSQDHIPLEQDDLERNCWLLRQIQGEVSVSWDENGVSNTCNEKKYLLFKLSARDWGRCVKSYSSGEYLAVVPDSWERDEALSGHAYIEPEHTSLEGYKAHFFDLCDKEKISFRTPDGPVPIETRVRFELVGQRINDASEEFGPLFGQSLPRIEAETDIWSQVEIIVVGEEGPGRGRWRKSFNPTAGKNEQELPPEVADRKAGWYFLRIYDKNDNLIDSLDYRFVKSLKDFRVLLSSPLPPTGGHSSVRVEFCHEPRCIVEPEPFGTDDIWVEHEDNKTTLTVPPAPAYDRTKWTVTSQDGPPVTVTVLIERVWWVLGLEDQPPTNWQDTPVLLSRDKFAATSRSVLWLKLPKRRWIDGILVGFEQLRARTYTVKVTEETVAIPLRDFGDFKEIGETGQEHRLKLWIEHDRTVNESTIGLIPAALLWDGRGRKKTAEARAILQQGTGRIIVNGQEIDIYFKMAPSRARDFLWRLLDLEQVHEIMARMDVEIKVIGSSQKTSRQAKAVAHALARSLVKSAPHLKPLFKQMGFGGVKVKDESNPWQGGAL